MTDPNERDLQVHLTVDDARTAQTAGASFARTLAGARSVDFALALAEQEELIRRAIMAAGYTAEQEELAVGHFGVAAREEWQRIANASGGLLSGTA